MDISQLKFKMRDIGFQVKDSAGTLTSLAVDSSKKLAEKIKIQNEIHKTETSLKQAYQNIGKTYLKLYGAEHNPAFAEYVAQIADCQKQLAGLQEQLSMLTESVPCPQCGNYVKMTQNFCPHCGAKLNSKESET